MKNNKTDLKTEIQLRIDNFIIDVINSNLTAQQKHELINRARKTIREM